MSEVDHPVAREADGGGATFGRQPPGVAAAARPLAALAGCHFGRSGAVGRLLAVDDNAASAELVARVAAKCGYEARSLSNPDKLRKLLHDWKPTVLTLDLCMPESDGIGLLAMLQEEGFDGTLVIVSGQDGMLRRAAAMIADGRGLQVAGDLQKPVALDALRDLLVRLLPEASPHAPVANAS